MMEAAERELFAKGVQDAVARSTGAELDVALDALGWRDALELDEHTAVAALFEAQGRAGATSGALDVVLARALGASTGLVVLPPFTTTSVPGVLAVDLVVVAGLVRGTGPAHVVAKSVDGLVLTTTKAGSPPRHGVAGLDPGLELFDVRGRTSAASATALEPHVWDATVAAGQRAIAHQLVGAAAAMLDLARDHAVERIQFDVPIASFQAVRHKLADSLVAVESARAALDAAWEAGSAFDAAVAKAIAGRSARLVAKHAQQVLAGIGFTMEHPLHGYLRRVRVLDGLLGDTRSLTRDLGAGLLEAGTVPPILPL